MPDPAESLIALERLLDKSPVFRELRDRDEWRNVRGHYMAAQLRDIEHKRREREWLAEHAKMLERIDELLAKLPEAVPALEVL